MFRKGFLKRKVKDAIDDLFDNPDDCQKLRNVLFDELLEACLDPEELAARLTRVFFKKTGRAYGHGHFYFGSKSDHIVLLWSGGTVDKILSKSANCEKGQYTHWVDSEFSYYEDKDVLRELHNDIERIEIDEDFHRTWSSYAKFVNWLLESEK